MQTLEMRGAVKGHVMFIITQAMTAMIAFKSVSQLRGILAGNFAVPYTGIDVSDTKEISSIDAGQQA